MAAAACAASPKRTSVCQIGRASVGNILSRHRTWAQTALWLLLAVLWFAAPASAENPAAPGKGLTLRRAIVMSLEYSPNLKQSLAELEKAQFQKKEAFTYFLPSFNTGYVWNKTQEPPAFRSGGQRVIVGSSDVYQWTTSFTQPLFTGMRLTSQYKLADLGVDLAQVNIMLATLDVVIRVKEAYFLYLRAIKGVGVAESYVKRLESQLRVSTDFHKEGIIPINDLLKVKVELANAVQDRVRAYNDRALSMSRLNRLLGLPVERRLEVADKLGHHPIEVDFVQAREEARRNRPELKSLGLQLEQADQAIRTVQSNYFPQVNLQGSYFFTSDSPEMGPSTFYDTTDWAIIARVDWSFWEWGRTRYQTSQVKAGKRRLEAARQDLQDQVDLQVREAVLFLREAQLNIATATTQVIQAKENYRITFDRYRNQLTTNTELLDAQFLLTQANTNYYNVLTIFNVAEASLQRAMGQGL